METSSTHKEITLSCNTLASNRKEKKEANTSVTFYQASTNLSKILQERKITDQPFLTDIGSINIYYWISANDRCGKSEQENITPTLTMRKSGMDYKILTLKSTEK